MDNGDSNSNGQILSPGRYRARAIQATLATTGTGKEQVVVEFAIQEPREFIAWYGFFTDKTRESTFRGLEACGWDGQDWESFAGVTGNEVELVVENEEDDKGVTRAKVRWVNEPGRFAVANPMAPAQAVAFGARMRGAYVAYAQTRKAKPAGGAAPAATARPSPSRSAPTPPPVDENDIPF